MPRPILCAVAEGSGSEFGVPMSVTSTPFRG